MRNRVRRGVLILGLVLVLAGAGVLLYPKFTAYQYAHGVTQQKEAFLQQVGQEADETDGVPSGTSGANAQLEQLYETLAEENRRLYEQHQPQLTDPFSYEQPAVDLSQYGLEDGIIGFLSIEKMDLELPIYLGANERNMTLGAAHMTNTSYPIGGENTNCVLVGHRGYYQAPMFRNIQKLELGDVVQVQNFREMLRYEVSEIEVVNPDEVECLYIRPGQDLLTLITCHPYPTNTYRYVVTCTRSA